MKIIAEVLLLLVAVLVISAQSAKQIDVFGRLTCDDYLARMQYTFNTAKENPTSLLVIIVYDGKVIEKYGRNGVARMVYPTRDSIEAKIRSIKTLMSLWKVQADRITIMNGGYREEPGVEIWSVAPGASAPLPTPTVDKMRFRKGKSSGFCTSCC